MRGLTPRVPAQYSFISMEITKTDLRKAIAYLDDAAKLYAAMPKPKHQWRAAQIRQLTAKLKSKNFIRQ